MTRVCLALLAILAVASAFTTPARPMAAAPKLFMFSAGDGEKGKGLSEVAPGDSADALQALTSATTAENLGGPEKKMMTVKNRNTGQLMEVEVSESFLANEKMEMNWWAWVGFVALPVILLANDLLHFIPADTPLKNLIKY